MLSAPEAAAVSAGGTPFPQPATATPDPTKSIHSLASLPLLERADALASIRLASRERCSHYPGRREAERFRAWLLDQGVDLGCYKYLDGYQQLALASPQDRERVAAACPLTPRAAFRVLAGSIAPRRPLAPEDTPQHIRAIEAGCAFLGALEGCHGLSEALAAVLMQVRREGVRRLKDEP
jgi:hypothetical protein